MALGSRKYIKNVLGSRKYIKMLLGSQKYIKNILVAWGILQKRTFSKWVPQQTSMVLKMTITVPILKRFISEIKCNQTGGTYYNIII